MTLTLITAFEVPPDADEPFIAGWARATRGGALHRALRADVDFRFVDVARVASPQVRWDAVSELGFAAHASAYEVVREHGTPDVEGGAVLIDPFEVGADEDGRFLAGWERARAVLARQRGHLGTRLHRSLGPADFRFVEIARWSSPLMFARALGQPDVERAVRELPFSSHPALYQVRASLA